MDTLTLPNDSAPARSEYTRFRACNECRRRRVKCDGRVSGCRHCLKASVKCVYNNPTRAGRKRKSPHGGSDLNAVDLDRRLERIERVVKQHLAVEGIPSPPSPESSLKLTPSLGPINPNPGEPKRLALYVWKVLDPKPTWPEENDGGPIQFYGRGTKFIGQSSVFSLFLNSGMTWAREKIGKPYFYDPLRREWAIIPGKNPLENALVGELGGCRSFTAIPEGGDSALPALHIAKKYINDYFDKVNSVAPIFDRERFDVELSMFYQNGSCPSPAWLLAFYMILALGCISEPSEESVAVRTASQTQALSFFWAGFRNMAGVLFCNHDISGVQALLATVLFLWETPSTEGCFNILGIVASMGIEIGFHCCGTQLGLPPREAELRRNLFWVTYILDKEISLRVGRPSSIFDSDISVKLPQVDINGVTPRLLHRVRLARIQSKVSRLLCSQSSSCVMSADMLLDTIRMLYAELEEWRSACGIMDEEILRDGEPITMQQNLCMRLSYFGCLGAIMRPLSPVFDLQAGLRPSDEFSTCLLFAARASVGLIDLFERSHLKLSRSTAVSLVATTVTLFVNILDNPLSESVVEDLDHIKRVADYLRVGSEKGCPGVSSAFLPTERLYSMALQTVVRSKSGAGMRVASVKEVLRIGG